MFIELDLVSLEGLVTILEEPVCLVLVRLDLQVLTLGLEKLLDELLGNHKLDCFVHLNFGGHSFQLR